MSALKFKLAYRNLFHDRLRFVATIVGIVFSIVLVTVQAGLYVGFRRMVTTMIDHSPADLWIMPAGTKCFEDPSLLDDRQRFRALAIEGVVDAAPLVIGYAQWRLPSGTTTPVFIVGSELQGFGVRPWNLVAGRVEDLSIPDAVAIDQSYSERLGVSATGANAEIRDQRVQVAAMTRGIRSFTTTPYVFAGVDRARAYTGMAPNKASYFLVRVSPDADAGKVRRQLRESLSDVEVLTAAEFRSRSRNFWLFGTGAGAALFAGALLGLIVGTVIVAQTLYSSTKDHLSEFATLRAIGSSSRYIYMVIVWQALLSAIVGFIGAAGISAIVVRMTAESALAVVVTPGMTFALFLLTGAMCVASAIAAIVQVMRIDPTTVLAR
ncbi:MAG: ABC transporter permease [Bradyrhizobium sp.]|uniref:ABC transporter permease n=1 Tax=Bradyrhizobium sp. TaxID=376 RepID=UPI002A25F175|nr:ABC transporter permease [Bradyrhizobium sp.]